MIVYFTLTAAVLALLLLVKKNTVSEYTTDGRLGFYRGMTRQDAINLIALVTIFLGLFAVSALRLNVGNDYGKYVEHMHLINSKTDGWTPKVPEEEGFKALTYVIYKLCGFENYVLVFAVFSFFTVLFFMKGIWRQSKWFEMSFAMFMLLGFYFQSLSTVRYYFGLGIALLSIEHLVKKDYPGFILMILLGAFFHKSLLIILVLYPIAMINWKKWMYALGVALGVSCWFLRPIYAKIAVRIYSEYQGTGTFDRMLGGPIHYSYISIVRCALILAVSIYLYKDVIKDNRENTFFFHCNIMSLALYVFAAFLTDEVISRIAYYLTITHVLFVPSLLLGVKDSKKRKMYTMLVLLGCLMYFVIFMKRIAPANGTRILPYTTIMFDDMPPILSETGY